MSLGSQHLPGELPHLLLPPPAAAGSPQVTAQWWPPLDGRCVRSWTSLNHTDVHLCPQQHQEKESIGTVQTGCVWVRKGSSSVLCTLPRSVLLLTRSIHSSCPSCPCPTLDKAARSVQARRPLPVQCGSPRFWSGWVAVLPLFPRTASTRKHQRDFAAWAAYNTALSSSSWELSY